MQPSFTLSNQMFIFGYCNLVHWSASWAGMPRQVGLSSPTERQPQAMRRERLWLALHFSVPVKEVSINPLQASCEPGSNQQFIKRMAQDSRSRRGLLQAHCKGERRGVVAHTLVRIGLLAVSGCLWSHAEASCFGNRLQVALPGHHAKYSYRAKMITEDRSQDFNMCPVSSLQLYLSAGC